MQYVVFLLLLFPALLMAQEEEPPATHEQRFMEWSAFSGSLRTAYWSSSRDLDDREHVATSALWLKTEPRLGQNVSLTLDGWVRNEHLFREQETAGKLREAYLDIRLGHLDLRVGRQIIVWGRADRLNPTDNLTPRDFTLLVPEDDDQRTGVAGLKASYYWGSVALTAIWLPEFIPHTIPLPHLPAPVTLGQRAPGDPLGQWAVRIEQTGKTVDWSLSFFDGFDRVPDVEIGQMEPSRVPLFLTYHRIRVLGADAATTVGRYGLRAEAAYTFTGDSGGKNPLRKNSFFYLVVGGDRTFLEYCNLNLQYFLRVVSDFHDPLAVRDPLRRSTGLALAAFTNQRDRVQHGASARISYKWFNETLEGELAGALSFTRLDFVLRPKLIYAFTDRWKGTIGTDIFQGSRNIFFGRLGDNSGLYVEVRYSF